MLHTMRKVAGLLLVFGLLLPGCSTAAPLGDTQGGDADNNNKLSVVTTIFPPYDFAREIAGDNADITMLLRPATESHSFEPTPKDIITIQNCDVFIYVGGESDEWVRGVLEGMDTSNMIIITLMDCVDAVEEELIEGMEEESEEEAAPELDEHVWTSPKNAGLIVRKLVNAFATADNANAAVYLSNTEQYLAKLNELDTTFQNIVDNAARKTIVLSDRFPFRYFADSYGLDYFAAFPGCSTETEASAATVAFLIDKVRDESIPVVFYLELSNQKMADTICEAANAKKLLLHSAHNVTKEDFENGISYLSIMNSNADNLREALQ